jgi:hypothetical protein
MLAGLGLLGGVAAARFVKASSEQRYGDYRRARGPLPTRSATATRSQPAAALDRGYAVSDDPLARDPYAGTR